MVLANLAICLEREGGTQRVPAPSHSFLWPLSAAFVADSSQKEIFLGGPKALQTNPVPRTQQPR